jgi:hypothetical protein
MRRALIVAALLSPGLATAQTTDVGHARLDLAGRAPSVCLISAPTAASGANATFSPAGAQQGQVTITELADPQTAVPRAASINLALPVICNAAHSVVISTANGGLARAGAGAAAGNSEVNGFRQFVPYQLSVSWAGQSANATSQPGPTITIKSNDGAAGQLSLVVKVPGGGAPLVAGAYGDQVIVQLQVAS